MQKAFVTGWPISHSKSPKLHRFWLDHHKISGFYEAVAIEPNNFREFLTTLPNSEFKGGNITLPHKERAYEMIKNRDEAAEMIGAVNTVWMQDGKLLGSNTDAYGFSANLDDFSTNWRKKKNALVVGAGGASRAIIHALIEAGFSRIHIANRTLERAKSLSDQFGEKTTAHPFSAVSELLCEAELLVNTTSIGMNGNNEDVMPNFSSLPTNALVTDIVYTPLQTPILKQAALLGFDTVDGLGMLLHQAVPGFEKWFGLKPSVTPELRNHILESL